MLDITKQKLKDTYKINDKAINLYERAFDDVKDQFEYYDNIREYNQIKVLNAMQKEKISESHFTTHRDMVMMI